LKRSWKIALLLTASILSYVFVVVSAAMLSQVFSSVAQIATAMSIQSILVMISILVVVTGVLAVADITLGSHEEKEININDKLKLKGSGQDTLLTTLANHKIFIPSACGGKATCGHCKVVVESGGGDLLPTEKGLLTKQEMKEGVRLACQVKSREDMKIHLPDDLLEVKEYTAEVVALHDLTRDIKHVKVRLLSPKTIHFRPGQYVQTLVPGFEAFRAYSVASPPSQMDTIEFTIRHIPKGLCTTYIHKALRVGDKLKFTGPYGHFYLKEDSDRPIVCIAGGAGMAPIRSIVSHLKEKNMPRKVSYYFGARSKRDLFFEDELRSIEENYPNFKFYAALSEPAPEDNWHGETGFITDTVRKYEDSLVDAEAYLCGPPPMLDAAVKVLMMKGISQERVLFDKF